MFNLSCFNLTCRGVLLSTVAGILSIAGSPNEAAAGCLGLFCGDWGGGWGAGYAPYYSGYSPYYTGYAPSYGYGYGGCSSGGCGCGYSGYVPSYGGCGSCGGCYASAGYGCSSCVGGNCGIVNPSSDPTRPSPDDGFRSGEGTGNGTDTPAPRRRRNPVIEGGGSNPAPRNDGLDSTRGNRNLEPETDPERRTFERPLGPKSNAKPPVDDVFDANRPAIPKVDQNKPVVPDDSFDLEGDPEGETKTNRPNLGAPVPNPQDEPADAAADNAGVIIPQKKHAPIDAEPEPEQIEVPEAIQPEEAHLDGKAIVSGVSPKSRIVLSGRFGTPSIVRLKLRPSQNWIASPKSPVIAQH